MSDSTPSAEVVLERVIAGKLRAIHTSSIGYIESYDAALGEADVQPARLVPFRNELGARSAIQAKVIPHCKVYFPGGGGTRDTWPVRRGDACLLIHPSHPIAKWLVRGGIVDEANDQSVHRRGSAIALVGIADLAHTTPAHPTARVLEADDLRLGSQTASEAALLGTSFVSATDTFLTALKVYVTATAGLPGMASPATAMQAAINAYKIAVDAAKSSKVKVAT